MSSDELECDSTFGWDDGGVGGGGCVHIDKILTRASRYNIKLKWNNGFVVVAVFADTTLLSADWLWS